MNAIGSTEMLSPVLQRVFDPGEDFEPIPQPSPSDWLGRHHEPGQTFGEFVRSKPNRPDARRPTIYLLPLGEFGSDQGPTLDELEACAEAFFAMPVQSLPMVPLQDLKVQTRINKSTGRRQLLSTDILQGLGKRLPRDAYCLLGVTMGDLYPEESWNFVFGQASLRDRVGVYSFARYDPKFYGKPEQEMDRELILRRACQVLLHETSHMFGMQHCIYYRCVLNGSNHLEESDSQPLHLCPACLRKLQWSTGLNVLDQYKKLHGFYAKVGLEDEAGWIMQRLNRISQP